MQQGRPLHLGLLLVDTFAFDATVALGFFATIYFLAGLGVTQSMKLLVGSVNVRATVFDNSYCHLGVRGAATL